MTVGKTTTIYTAMEQYRKEAINQCDDYCYLKIKMAIIECNRDLTSDAVTVEHPVLHEIWTSE